MAIEPGTYNFTLQRRSTHNIPLVFKDSSNNAVNLTGYTIAAQVWDEPRLNKYADFAVTYTDRSAGSVTIGLTSTQTATFITDTLVYDVLLVNPSNVREYYLEGKITMSEGYTTV
jgi:hypothetical protein